VPIAPSSIAAPCGLVTANRFRASLVALLAAITVLAGSTSPARGDSDPASDMLLGQDSFYPYQPPVSTGMTKALDQAVSEAKAAGLPIKVALIGSAIDLGGLPQLYGQPQKYSDFLAMEIAFNGPVKLLVVMPQGFGLTNVGTTSSLAALPKPQPGPDGLARAAISAVEKLAADAGHPIQPPEISAAGGGGGLSPALTFGAPAALLIVVAALYGLTRRRPGLG
jgi:hypothetical protein